jgi:hypothetical protein
MSNEGFPFEIDPAEGGEDVYDLHVGPEGDPEGYLREERERRERDEEYDDGYSFW